MSLEIIAISYLLPFLGDDRPQLSPEERQRRDRRNPRIAIQRYALSPFKYLYASGNDQALLNCCACDHQVFRQLLHVFAPVFYSHTWDEKWGRIRPVTFARDGTPKGRHRQIDAIGCLGLVLYWYRTRGSVARSACMAFGLTSTPVYKWLKFSRRILLFVLQKNPLAVVRPPTEAEVGKYSASIAAKYPILQGSNSVWAAMDGLKTPLQQPSDWFVQNRYYNGWGQSTYINSVFVFAPDGLIRMCVVNAPGCFHDSSIAEFGIYDKLERVFEETGAKVVVDSAFALKRHPFLIKSSQTDPEGVQGVLLNRAATSVRQLSEHGMRMIQGQFPRLKDRMTYEEFGEREVILSLMVLLYNFTTSTVGHNMILNSFMSRTEGFHSYGTLPETANDIFLEASE